MRTFVFSLIALLSLPPPSSAQTSPDMGAVRLAVKAAEAPDARIQTGPFWATDLVVKWSDLGKQPQVVAFNQEGQSEKLRSICLRNVQLKQGSFLFVPPFKTLNGSWVSWVVVDTVSRKVLYYIKGLRQDRPNEVAIYEADKRDEPACKEDVCGEAYWTTLLTVPCTYDAPLWPPVAR